MTMMHCFIFINLFTRFICLLLFSYQAICKGFNRPGYVKNRLEADRSLFDFQGIYTLFYSFIDDQSLTAANPFEPQWSLWFC
ncbi:hypothetical protein PO124_34860 [Bacillus licheniformis]|nr:hypothetical protein [Bacillus licheniformis]